MLNNILNSQISNNINEINRINYLNKINNKINRNKSDNKDKNKFSNTVIKKQNFFNIKNDVNLKYNALKIFISE
jgi:hypothetical protein